VKRSIFLAILIALFFLSWNHGLAQVELPLLIPYPGKFKGLYSTQAYVDATLNRVNYYREIAGLSPVSKSDLLSQVAQAHADYLNVNNEAGHYETQGKPNFVGVAPKDRADYFGYSWGSIGEVISFGVGAEEGIDNLMAAIYHRFIILSPSFTEAGVGDAAHPTYGVVEVVNFGRPKTTPSPTKIIAIYPGDGQEEVPTSFNSDTEYPDPVPGKGVVGYPISIHFSSDYTIFNPQFSLYKDEQLVETVQVNNSETQPTAFSIIPWDKLEANTLYKVVFTATVNDSIYEKIWTFKTVKSDTLSAVPSELTITVGSEYGITLKNFESPFNVGWSDSSIISVTANVSGKVNVKALKLGSCTITITDAKNETFKIPVWVVNPYELNINDSWNLLSSLIQLDVAQSLDNAIYESIWKWMGNNWAVYLPGKEDKGKSYAEQKGFNLLSQIGPGDGFWIKSKEAGKLTITGGYGPTKIQVKTGWNLLGLKKPFSYPVGDLIADNASKVESLWKWEGNAWAVYLPNEKDYGESYASQKKFGFVKTISPGEGFWVKAKEAFELN